MIGTVVSCPYGNVMSGPYDPPDRVNVLWHHTGITTGYYSDLLVLYVNPLDAPGRSSGAHRTWSALKVVMNAEQPHAMEEMQRDLERARMEREDLRTATFSPFGPITTPNGRRMLTWREYGIARNETTEEYLAQIVEATDILRDARRDALVTDNPNAHRPALKAARNRIIDALEVLEGSDADMSGDE